jgi:hypothetical protein
MLDEQTVRNILRDRLLTVPGLDGSKGGNVSFQNRQFSPPAPTREAMWVSESMEFVDENLNATELVQADGLAVYRVYTIVGSSTELSSATALAIIDAFRPGQSLRTVGGVPQDCGVVLNHSFRHSPFEDGGSLAWYVQPVQVDWRVHVSNPASF